ncbi:hypothetical protein [Limnospira platensis]
MRINPPTPSLGQGRDLQAHLTLEDNQSPPQEISAIVKILASPDCPSAVN